jgi:hypothetical protein
VPHVRLKPHPRILVVPRPEIRIGGPLGLPKFWSSHADSKSPTLFCALYSTTKVVP